MHGVQNKSMHRRSCACGIDHLEHPHIRYCTTLNTHTHAVAPCSVAAHNACYLDKATAKRQKDLCSISDEDPMDRHCNTKADIIFLIGLLGLGTVSAG